MFSLAGHKILLMNNLISITLDLFYHYPTPRYMESVRGLAKASNALTTLRFRLRSLPWQGYCANEDSKQRLLSVASWVGTKERTIEYINKGLGALGKLEAVTTGERDDETWFWARDDGGRLNANAWSFFG
jgi:hypothetical protein